MTSIHRRPERTEAPDYFFTYIEEVAGDDIGAILDSQATETLSLLKGISEEDSLRRYAPDKWSIRELVNHVNDCERLFAFRAFWFARGFESPLPSFDQNVAAAAASGDALPLSTHVAEFATVRWATRTLVASLPDEAWSSKGIASGNTFTVRAMTFLAAGHVAHHMRILREKYL
jgi:hypothetical protein